jgi:hypothetical protein
LNAQTTFETCLTLPPPGSSQLTILSPNVLELSLVTTKRPHPAPIEQWNFVDDKGAVHLPSVSEFTVKVGEKPLSVSAVGFKRRVLYAPFKKRDLRIANYLYLKLGSSLKINDTVKVTNPSHKLWPDSTVLSAVAGNDRLSPAIHVNQTGYAPAAPKHAMIGYYLGSLGELDIPGADSIGQPVISLPAGEGRGEAIPVQLSDRHSSRNPADGNSASSRFGEGRSAPTPAQTNPQFQIIDAVSGKPVFTGTLTPRPDRGFDSYQGVFEADFTEFKTPGQYRLAVPGLGASFPFYISEGVAAAFARTYALGIYHQRCGTNNDFPFTRFTHGPCHLAAAEVPDASSKFQSANDSLKKESADFKDNPRHTAPQLKEMSASLYPFVKHGRVDVQGGHHDAGDYSKYTINSAAFIHCLVFAADVFPGVSDLDNLGIPESGDGKSDVLQEAKWEADFLARMQDDDGGFYFLVYPRDREYEIDVLPDHGDPQIVFPKTTAVTAAATAALAQCASSPAFKKQFPEAANLCLEKARRGWAFLERAIAKYGKDGAYQKITHYGDQFMHDDELAWAACELYIATGEKAYEQKLLEWLHPNDPATRVWGWQRLSESYGNAIRSYTFAVKAGKLRENQVDRLLREQCENEIVAAGEDQLRRASESAYGTSFPVETKRVKTAGWYFSSDAAFDLATAYQLDYPILNDPRPKLLDALLSNLNYEQGCNPVNVAYLTGLGWHRQREIVDQYAQNDRRILPPSGIPLGNIQAGPGWIEIYKKELSELSFPTDGDSPSSYPFYDRWSDAFNLSQEFVIVNQAKALAYMSWLMAQTPLKSQPWRSASARIATGPDPKAPNQIVATLSSPQLDLTPARIVWETAGHEPFIGQQLRVTPANHGAQWLEAEAQLPDGRRVCAVTNFSR